ncbi:MAG TPA: CBS domain-containing protein, partial [Candidatus Saccharimonadales bacterium]|nr:CBS domain-containing protein [Candidatus Saccharimonadales bacterium]
HSRLYEKEDLTALLRAQKNQPDNRISLEELELADRALRFSDRHAADIVQPRKQTLLVNADDSIGPILLDQLHKSGQSSFLVYRDEQENIVGSLLMRDAVNAKHGGRVFELVRGDLCYVHEDFTLHEVLAAFQRTGHHTAVVINSFEEFVGILSLDALLRELVGEATVEFENYEDRASIAHLPERKRLAASQVQTDADQSSQANATSPEATGVVE